jgi:hypothetical protein
MGKTSENLQQLLQRKLSRKEFLQVIGLTLLSLIGVNSMLRNIDKSLSTQSRKNETVYSEDPYGG